jgi:hypothetical protein
MHPIAKMFLGAASLAAAALAGLNRRRLQEQVNALSRRVDELADRTQIIPVLKTQTEQNSQAIFDIRSSVTRMEQAFTVLGDRVATQIEILEALQSSYNQKEQKLQTTLQAVIDAVTELRRLRTPAQV